VSFDSLIALAGSASAWEILALATIGALAANRAGVWEWGSEARRLRNENVLLRRDMERLTQERDAYRDIAKTGTATLAKLAELATAKLQLQGGP